MPYVPVSALSQYVGKELGRSEWLKIDQQRINLFAEATGTSSSSMSTRTRPPRRHSAAPSPTVS